MLLVATVVSILAVDFPLIFPRNLCKTEEYGISLVKIIFCKYALDGCWSGICNVFFRAYSEKDKRFSFTTTRQKKEIKHLQRSSETILCLFLYLCTSFRSLLDPSRTRLSCKGFYETNLIAGTCD